MDRGGILILPGDSPSKIRITTSVVIAPRLSILRNRPPTMPAPSHTPGTPKTGALARAERSASVRSSPCQLPVANVPAAMLKIAECGGRFAARCITCSYERSSDQMKVSLLRSRSRSCLSSVCQKAPNAPEPVTTNRFRVSGKICRISSISSLGFELK